MTEFSTTAKLELDEWAKKSETDVFTVRLDCHGQGLSAFIYGM